MAGNYHILQDVADFAPGYFENTAVEEGCVQLLAQSEGYPESGSYTSPPFHTEAFFSLIPSWNADTPAGTSVEMQVRLAADGRWSRWFGFGKWSPYMKVGTPEPQQDEIAGTDGEMLDLREGMPAADIVQMRVFLATDDPRQTPQVRLMAVSTDAAQKQGHEQAAYARRLEMPAYSCQNRDPALAGHIAGATTLTMMMNRRGRDLLPEEVARVAYDATGGRYDNLSFLCAAAGCFGFASHVAYAGIAALRREVWEGRAVAARVHYRAALPGAEEDRPGPPVLEGATTPSSGHLVAVHGFVQRDGKDHVLLCDPLAPTDAAVRMEITLSAFAKIYTGTALFMAGAPKGSGSARPGRRLAELKVRDNLLRLSAGGEGLVPGRLGDEALQPHTLCYTLSDGIAYASSAQRKFYYPLPDVHGSLRFERAIAEGRRITFYFIAAGGNFWVAEKMLEKPEVLDEKILNQQEDEENDL